MDFNKILQAAMQMFNKKEEPKNTAVKYVWNDLRPTMTPMPDKDTYLRNLIPTPPPDKAALPYYEKINEEAKKTGVPKEILYRLLRTESNFNPNALGPEIEGQGRATGIGQFMPATAKGMGFDPTDPMVSIAKSAQYLADKKKQHGTWANTLASYNAGSGNVEKYGGVPPFPETINYVKKILKDLPYE